MDKERDRSPTFYPPDEPEEFEDLGQTASRGPRVPEADRVEEVEAWEVISEDDLMSSDGELRIYLPQVAANTGTTVTWVECDLGLPSRREDRTLGRFIRRRLGLLDERVRTWMLNEARQLGLTPDQKGLAALGRAYGLDLRPGDEEVCCRLAEEEMEPEAIHRLRPGDGCRWLFEAGLAGLPVADESEGGDLMNGFLRGLVPMTGLLVRPLGRTEVIPHIESLSFEEILHRTQEMGGGGPLVLVPSCSGLFVRMEIPIFQRSMDCMQEVLPENLVLFFSDDTDLDVLVRLAQGMTARYLLAQVVSMDEARREPGNLRIDEVLFIQEGEGEAFPTADLDHRTRNLLDLAQQFPTLLDSAIRFTDEPLIRRIEEAARLADVGESFSVTFKEAGALTCLTDRICDAA